MHFLQAQALVGCVMPAAVDPAAWAVSSTTQLQDGPKKGGWQEWLADMVCACNRRVPSLSPTAQHTGLVHDSACLEKKSCSAKSCLAQDLCISTASGSGTMANLSTAAVRHACTVRCAVWLRSLLPPAGDRGGSLLQPRDCG